MKNLTRLLPIPITVLLAMLCLSAGLSTSAYAQEVQAELRPETFSIDETATLQITIEHAQDADISMPEIDGLIFHTRGQSSQIQIVNGSVASSVVYTYLVEPVKAGRYEIPPIRIKHKNTTLLTKPLACMVTQSSAGQNRQQSAQTEKSTASESLSFISFTPEKDKIYRGEVIPITIKAYFKRGTRVNQLTLPRMLGEGLLIDELSNNPPQIQEVVDNVAYNVLVWDTFITGVKEGVHETSFELDATVLMPSRKRSALPGFGSGLFNDDFFGDMFSNYTSKSVQATSEKTAIDVVPLPESSKPESFSGAVGRFTMKLDARPTTIDPGEPVTLTMTVAGTGNFAVVGAPTLSDTSGIKVYSPTATFTPGQSPYNGTKQFQQAIIVTDPSATEIPPVIFSYFDPEAKQYRTLFSDPVALTVNPLIAKDAPAKTAPAPAAAAPDSSQPTGSSPLSLVPVKLEPGTLVNRIRPPFLKMWFVAVTSLCITMIAGFFGFRMYHGIQAGNAKAAHKKAFISKRKETLNLLDGLHPDAPDFPAQARKLVGDLLIVHQQSDCVSLTTADVVDRYGSDSVAAELFRLGDVALYGKQDRSSADRQDLQKRIKTFVTKLT